MKNTTLLSVLFSLFFYAIGTAQSDNKVKILGCWEAVKVEFPTSSSLTKELNDGIKGTIVCFDTKGNFSNTKKGFPNGKGTYSFSKDGKTMYQESRVDSLVENTPCEVITLTDKEFKVKANDLIMYFKKSTK